MSTSKRKIIKNLTVICFGFLFLFTACSGLHMLQSTINQEHGIGVASLTLTYASFCASALILPQYTIKKLGCKRTLYISMSCYIPYIAANFYFTWFTMVPTAILAGLASSLIWTSQCTYYNESAVTYSKICHDEIQEKNNKLTSCDTKCKDVILKEGNIENLDALKIKDVSLKGLNIENLNVLDVKYISLNEDNIENLAALNVKDFSPKEKIIKNLDVLNVKNVSMKEDSIENSDVLIVKEKENKINGDCETHIKSSVHNEEDKKDTTKEEPATVSGISDNNLRDSCFQKGKILSEPNSEVYSKLVSSVTARFFGLFCLIFRTSEIWSNLISYYVLNNNIVLDNITENGNCSCGASFCNVKSNCFSHNLAEPSQQMRNTLVGISVCLAVFSVFLVLVFLDNLHMDTKEEPVAFSLNHAMATFKFVKRKEALFLLPLSAYIGLQQGFYSADFTKSYIACAWGIYHVGLVSTCYGLFAGISGTVAGMLVKYIGRLPVMIMGGVINAAVCILLLTWNPMPDQSWKFFLFAAMCGASVGILWSQLKASYGVMFKEDEEAAFAGFYLWDSIGYCVTFSYSNYICTYLKIYILLSVSTLGMIGYIKAESIYVRKQKESRTDT